MIIGLTGKSASGKGTVAEYLKEKGYVYHSCSDILRLELKERGIEENLPNLIKIGNELRNNEGPGVLGKRILELIRQNGEENSLADSIRNPAEIEELKKAGNSFILIAVDAPVELRYERMSKRGRAGDNISLEDFKILDAKQFQSDDPNAQQILKCLQLADYRIVNDGTVDELYQEIEAILGQIK